METLDMILNELNKNTIDVKTAKERILKIVNIRPFEIGSRVKIISCRNGHEFDVGEVVTLIGYKYGMWLAQNKHEEWYVDEVEFELIS